MDIPLSASKFASYFGNYSIKHDLARSCFQLWPKIGDKGDKISSIKHDLARSCFQFWLKIGDEGDKIARKELARR